MVPKSMLMIAFSVLNMFCFGEAQSGVTMTTTEATTETTTEPTTKSTTTADGEYTNSEDSALVYKPEKKSII